MIMSLRAPTVLIVKTVIFHFFNTNSFVLGLFIHNLSRLFPTISGFITRWKYLYFTFFDHLIITLVIINTIFTRILTFFMIVNLMIIIIIILIGVITIFTFLTTFFFNAALLVLIINLLLFLLFYINIQWVIFIKLLNILTIFIFLLKRIKTTIIFIILLRMLNLNSLYTTGCRYTYTNATHLRSHCVSISCVMILHFLRKIIIKQLMLFFSIWYIIV